MTFQVTRHEQNHMATIFDFRISCLPEHIGLAGRTLRECHLLVAQLECELSEFLDESPVFRLNHSEPGTRIHFTPSGIELLERAFELKRLSLGAFNPLSKSQGENPDLEWHKETREVWKKTRGTWLGFGAIGKGYALDQARRRIESAGFENYLLSGGGSSIALSGRESPMHPWKWGWSWKKSDSGENLGISLTHSSGKRVALGVSGTHEKGRHLIGARADLKSALVGLPSATDADALSTALFVSGWEQSKSYLSRLPLAPATAWIDQHEKAHWNGVFQNLWNGALSVAICALSLFSTLSLRPHQALCDDSVDLGALGDSTKSFTPYVFDRNTIWVLLPIFMFILVLSHLRKTKPKRDRQGSLKKLMKKNPTSTTPLILAAIAWMSMENAHAVQIEPMGQAIASLLGTTKAFKKVLNDGKSNVDVFYSKGSDGKAEKAVFVEKGIYPPDCTHTWAIGLDVRSDKVTGVHPLEMGCPHAYPTKSASFLDQFTGKGPADVATLDADVHVVAKATGTSKLATDAVKRSITTLQKYKGQF